MRKAYVSTVIRSSPATIVVQLVYLLLIADEEDDPITNGDVEQHAHLTSEGLKEVLDTSCLSAKLSRNMYV